MASKPKTDVGREGKSDRLPFEPSSSRKKGGKAGKGAAATSPASKPMSKRSETVSAAKKSGKSKSSTPSRPSKYSRQEAAIPEVVSRRMIKRMAVLSGVPTVMGLSTFVISYFVVVNGVIDLPSVAVLLVSLGFFGLGVLGISYGALSTSWDIDSEGGSLLGWAEFTTNIGRMKQAWQESRNQS